MASGSRSEPKPGSPSFFKVVRYPSSPHMSLPVAFVKRYLDKIPKNPTLKTATGEHSWKLKFEKIGEDYCFADGWEKLAEDAELRIKDIVVFWLIDSFTFQVSFFDEHGCEKDLPLNNTSYVSLSPNWVLTDKSESTGDGDEDEDDDDDDYFDDSATPDQHLYFQKVISAKTHRYAMSLPKKIVNAAGLEKKPSIKLKDNEGNEWNIGLRTESYRSTKVFLSVGWRRFQRYHELSDGDMCFFKYSKEEGVLILAQLIKNKRLKKPETEVEGVNWKIERPPVEKLGGGGGGFEYDSGPEAEVLKRKRGRPVSEEYSGGGVEVKIEDESWPEEWFSMKKKEMPPFEKLGGGGGGGGVKVKIEDESETERVFQCNRVVYF